VGTAEVDSGLRFPLVAAGIVGLILLPFIVNWPSMSDFFMSDDFIWLKAASSHGFFDLMARETSLNTRLDIFDYPTPYVRPLVDAYFWVTYRIFGFDAGAYHALAISLHAAVGLLVALLGWQLSRSRVTGFAAAALFLVLPTYDMAVTWVSEATDLIYTLFYLLAMTLFLAHLRRGSGRGWPYAASLVAFTLALLSKEPAITMPAAAAILAFLETPVRLNRRLLARAMDLLPFFVLALAFYLKFYRHEQSGLSNAGLFGVNTGFFSNFWDYLRWLTFPFGSLQDSTAVRLFTTLAFLGGGFWALLRGRRAPAFLFLWTILALVPPAFLNEGLDRRYGYLAAAPFALFLTLSAAALLRLLAANPRLRFALVFTLVALAVPVLAQASRDRQHYSHDQATYYQAIYYDVPGVCGPLPPGSLVYVVGSPAFDWSGIDTQTALNFSYERVKVLRADHTADVPSDGGTTATCIARWDGSGFVREK
jgi:hypothetical protein